MRKRITALTMAGVMTAALLSGCSGGNSTSTTTAGGAADTTGAEADHLLGSERGYEEDGDFQQADRRF